MSGVCGYSTVAGQSRYFIFAVGDLYRVHQFRSWASDKKIGFKSLMGAYNGVVEHSFIANVNDYELIRSYGWLDGQESVLELGVCDSRNHRPATLYYLDSGELVDIGMFRPINWVEKGMKKYEVQAEYLKNNPWTFDPSTATHFECVA